MIDIIFGIAQFLNNKQLIKIISLNKFVRKEMIDYDLNSTLVTKEIVSITIQISK